ncbi:MAG: hypothetical protein V1738_00520 [Patescibacteria group bacterium]
MAEQKISDRGPSIKSVMLDFLEVVQQADKIGARQDVLASGSLTRAVEIVELTQMLIENDPFAQAATTKKRYTLDDVMLNDMLNDLGTEWEEL